MLGTEKIRKMIASGAEKGRQACTDQLNLELCQKQPDGSLSTPEQRDACEHELNRHYKLCVQSVFAGRDKAFAELDSLFATNAGKTLVPGKR